MVLMLTAPINIGCKFNRSHLTTALIDYITSFSDYIVNGNMCAGFYVLLHCCTRNIQSNLIRSQRPQHGKILETHRVGTRKAIENTKIFSKSSCNFVYQPKVAMIVFVFFSPPGPDKLYRFLFRNNCSLYTTIFFPCNYGNDFFRLIWNASWKARMRQTQVHIFLLYARRDFF